MTPENITIGQLFQMLTVRQLWSVGIGVCAIAGVIYLMGQTLTTHNFQQEKVKSAGTVNRLEQENNQLKGKLDTALHEKMIQNQEISELKKIVMQYQQDIKNNSQQIAELSKKLTLQGNCVFVHAEIKRTQKEIYNVQHSGIFGFDDSDVKREQEVTQLEERLARFQQQLSTCNRY